MEVNFPKPLEGRNKVTSLETPHRIADALIRDSLVINENQTPFAQSKIGKRFSASTYADATALYEYCPTALIFGVWDSHGSGGGLGNKFARALVSEIVGFDALEGVRTGGRLDPYNTASKIEERIYQHKDPDKRETTNRSEAAVDEKGNPILMRIEGKIFKHENPELKWTFDPNEAEKDDKGKPLMVGKDAKEKGKPAAIGHGNIPPAVASEEIEKGKFETFSGGVTISSALQTTVLSFPQLRRLRFPAPDGSPSPERNKAGRVVLAALALHAIALQKSEGYLLRSRSQLVPVPKEPPTIKFIDQNGEEDDVDAESFTVEATKSLLDGAVAAATDAHLSWQIESVKLVPSRKLLKLLELSQAGRGAEEAS
jgi:CRISPR-associated protein Csb1